MTDTSGSNRRMSSSEKICQWGKYMIGIAALVLTFLIYEEFTQGSGSEEVVLPRSSSSTSITRDVDQSHTINIPRDIQVHQRLFRNFQAPNCDKLTSLKSVISTAQLEIWNEWNVSYYPQFLNMMHIPQRSWDLQKAKFIKMLLHDQLESSAEDKFENYVVGFSGSSVTAGHGMTSFWCAFQLCDNSFYHLFTIQCYR